MVQQLGKSDFAIKLAKIKGEIINADSMQVYKELKFYLQGHYQNTIIILNTIYMVSKRKKKFFLRRLVKIS